ncbi:aminotransferase class V-fold PLP-dependent enzyme [Klugiella xanthotipulae]|uniref:Glutamate/tyrosine decarboxylase-like PLP-dependent enzyme n=1 Tax=Klugiella xanthotipulae TaxID=244735 RepID=A0A543HXV2_9MICO|nr:aminotransferase class V-fold PLP-dependent enzyme [Klugiella xanthotipulae]TQM63162.1 glutamate/tyrosine decarboxylase-like PLP-dependent enzyme [Klugiella xanthotipulae]
MSHFFPDTGATTPSTEMHIQTPHNRALLGAVLDYARDRMANDQPLDFPATPAELAARVPRTITPTGLGGPEALRIFEEILAPACISTDHPGYLSFIPTAATEAATMFDLAVAACSVYGGSWLEGAGAVHAENEVLRWLAAQVGLPAGAGGVFVQGGTIGNLSALVAARFNAQSTAARNGTPVPDRWAIACSREAHSSLRSAARVMDVDLLPLDPDPSGRLTGDILRSALDAQPDGGASVCAVVATAGTTNLGIIDDLAGIGELCRERDIWFHVDGAYGLAAILVPELAPLFAGAEYADSFIVDPHKWLFTPFDACALVYRDPRVAYRTHSQHAEYLDTLEEETVWNPSDYAIQLTRRARGLPLWFSLASYGTERYRLAIESTVMTARAVAKIIRETEHLELVCDPTLSIVAFSRLGWEAADYRDWSARLLTAGTGFVTPSSHHGKPILRFAIVNPRSTLDVLVPILDTLR